jgi:hypothetical protein
METVAPLLVAVIQFAVFTFFTWLIVRKVEKLFTPEKKLTFGKHLKMMVVMIPILLSISLLARFVQIPLDGLSIGSFLRYTLSHFVPDVVSIGLMAIFINSFFFGQSGFKSMKSIVLSIQSTSGKMVVNRFCFDRTLRTVQVCCFGSVLGIVGLDLDLLWFGVS